MGFVKRLIDLAEHDDLLPACLQPGESEVCYLRN